MSEGKNWHPADVKAALEKSGVTMSGLSQAHGYARNVCVASIRQPMPAGNHIIANHLGLSVHVIWPEWYDASGGRIYDNSNKKYTRRMPWRLRQKSENA